MRRLPTVILSICCTAPCIALLSSCGNRSNAPLPLSGGRTSRGLDHSEGAMYMANLRRTGFYDVEPVRILHGIRWKFVPGCELLSIPVVSDGMVFVGGSDGKMRAIRADDGSLVWDFSTSAPIRTCPSVADGTVFFGSLDRSFYAVSIDGKLVWSIPTNEELYAPSYVHGGRVYFAGNGGTLYCTDMHSGDVIWTSRGEEPRLSLNAPSTDDGMIYLTSAENEKVYIVDASAGKVVHVFEGGPSATGTVSPAVDSGLVYYGGATMCAMDIRTRTRKWCFPRGNMYGSSPAVANGSLYFASWELGQGNPDFFAIDASNGEMKWSFRNGGSMGLPPAIARNVVYFGSHVDSKLYAVSASDGAPLWSLRTKGLITPPVPADHVVYFVGMNGILYSVQ